MRCSDTLNLREGRESVKVMGNGVRGGGGLSCLFVVSFLYLCSARVLS